MSAAVAPPALTELALNWYNRVVRMRINNNQAASIKDRPVTAQRQVLLDMLRQARGHLDAKELYRRAIESDRNISLATVYRNLRLFKELGLVDELRQDEVHCYYEIKRSTEHYHLVCVSCGRIVEFENALVTRLVAEVQDGCGFKVSKAVLHMEGYCQRCRPRSKTGRTEEQRHQAVIER